MGQNFRALPHASSDGATRRPTCLGVPFLVFFNCPRHSQVRFPVSLLQFVEGREMEVSREGIPNHCGAVLPSVECTPGQPQTWVSFRTAAANRDQKPIPNITSTALAFVRG